MLNHWFGACESGGGGDQGSQEKLAILWKCWTAERVERFENTGSWAGAMGAREFDVHEPPRVTDLMLWCGLTRLARPRGHARIRHQIRIIVHE